MKPSRLTLYAICLTSFLLAASHWRALGLTERARLSANNAKACYLSLRYYIGKCTPVGVED